VNSPSDQDQFSPLSTNASDVKIDVHYPNLAIHKAHFKTKHRNIAHILGRYWMKTDPGQRVEVWNTTITRRSSFSNAINGMYRQYPSAWD
jgi:hypothetical protein